ncbi:MAG: SEC-C domain-containing protein [Nitrospirota bacterium]
MIKQIRRKISAVVSAAHSTKSEEKIPPGRNEPCWCGSGVKYKNCHLKYDADRSFHNNLFLSLAALIPIISTWMGTQIMYWSGNSGNWLWFWTQSALSVAIGVLCIIKMSSLSKTKRSLAVLSYVAVIFFVVSAVGFITACFNGDCL